MRDPPSATQGLPCPEFDRDDFAGGVTGLEESLWPFALQQGVSAGRASGGARLGNISLVPFTGKGRSPRPQRRELTKFENKRFAVRVNVFFSATV